MSWEHFHHGADIGVRGRGADIATAFAQAAIAMSAVITAPEDINPLQAVEIHCQAPDDEILLLDWLNALILEMDTRSMLFSRFEVSIAGHTLQARAWGEPVEVGRHHPAVEVKGATFTELKVVQDAKGQWLAQCVVDV